jgi:two-component system response regulator RegA
MNRFLIIDDDAVFVGVLSHSLQKKGHEALIANDAATALNILRDSVSAGCRITRVVLDLKLAETTGLQLLPQLLAIDPCLQIVMLTGYASVATTVEAIKLGAHNYLCKPASTDEILAVFDDTNDIRRGAMLAPGRVQHAPAIENPLTVGRVEWEYIQRQLAANQGNIAATARALGMHRRTLQRKLQKKPGKF